MINNQELEKIIKFFQKNIFSTKRIIDIVKEQLGFSLDTIQNYQIGWTGFDFTYNNIRYYRNCITVPIRDHQGIIKNIRFYPVKSDKISINKVLNFHGLSKCTTFYGNQQENPDRYWLFENELEAIRVVQGLKNSNYSNICVLCSTSRRASIPEEWHGSLFFRNRPVYIFFDDSQLARSRERNIIQMLGENARPVHIKDRDIFVLFNSLGDLKAIKYLLKLEEDSRPLTLQYAKRKKILKSMLIDKGQITLINPAQDFKEEVAYYTVGVWKLTEYKVRKGVHTNYTIAREVVPYIVTSNGILAEVDETLPHKIGVVLKFQPCLPVSSPRWSLKSIQAFIQRELNSEVKNVINKILDVLKKCFIFTQEEDCTVLACWIIGTYLFRLFPVFPILYMHTDNKEVGEVLASTVKKILFNGWVLSECSSKVLFDIITGYSPTMVINSALLYTRNAGIKIMRKILQKGADTHGESYPVNTNKPCLISVEVKRLKSKEDGLDEVFGSIRDCLYHFAMEHWQQIQKRITQHETHIKNNIWTSLSEIAKIFGSEIFTHIQVAKSYHERKFSKEIIPLELKACLQVLQSRVRKQSYPGYVYASDIAKSMRELYPDELGFISWRDALRCLRKLGFNKMCQKRTNRGYKTLCPKLDIIQLLKKYEIK